MIRNYLAASWRNLIRNPEREENVQVEMLSIGRSLGTEMKR